MLSKRKFETLDFKDITHANYQHTVIEIDCIDILAHNITSGRGSVTSIWTLIY